MSTPALESAPRGGPRPASPPPQDATTNDPDRAAAGAAPAADARVQEVLENGGFLSLPRTRKAARDGVDVYEYQRLSRGGRPLAGAEARRPPAYTLTATGILALTCTCPEGRRTRALCKHQAALIRSLTGRVAPPPETGGHS